MHAVEYSHRREAFLVRRIHDLQRLSQCDTASSQVLDTLADSLGGEKMLTGFNNLCDALFCQNRHLSVFEGDH